MKQLSALKIYLFIVMHRVIDCITNLTFQLPTQHYKNLESIKKNATEYELQSI